MIAWLIIGLGFIVWYECLAIVTHQTTISQFVWRLSKDYPALPFAFGLLMGHLFLTMFVGTRAFL